MHPDCGKVAHKGAGKILRACALLGFLSVWLSTRFAQAGEAGQAPLSYTSPPEYSWSGYFMGLAVLFVMLAVLWAGAKFLRQKGALRFLGMSPHFKVESRLSLGAKKHLIVLDYHGKRLLLGVTDHHISLLNTENRTINAEHQDTLTAVNEEHNDTLVAGVAAEVNKTANFGDILHELGKK